MSGPDEGLTGNESVMTKVTPRICTFLLSPPDFDTNNCESVKRDPVINKFAESFATVSIRVRSNEHPDTTTSPLRDDPMWLDVPATAHPSNTLIPLVVV